MRTKIRSSLGMAVAAVLMIGVMVGSGCATPEQSTEEPAAVAAQEEAVDEMVEYLFVQHAEGVTLAEGVLTLEGIGEDVLYFSDRPHRIVGRITLEDFLGSWDEGEESFAEVPPNAVLTVKQENELRDLTVVLKDPVLTEGTLVYQVEVLDGPESGSGDFAALFIDVIGNPVTGPMGTVRRTSRRTARRTARRVDRRQDYYDESRDYDDGQDYDESSELEEGLRELDDLLAQGLITQEDYDREKKELLDRY